jgi:hypothetical protein
MSVTRTLNLGHGLLALFAALIAAASTSASAQQPPQQKPNILFIMGDDIGLMQVEAYHQGIMVGETPNIDRIAREGANLDFSRSRKDITTRRNF